MEHSKIHLRMLAGILPRCVTVINLLFQNKLLDIDKGFRAIMIECNI
jgi:hypothetical protein